MSDYMDIIFGALIVPKYEKLWIKLFGLDESIDEKDFWYSIKKNRYKIGGYDMAPIRMGPGDWSYLMVYSMKKNIKVEDFKPSDLEFPDSEDFNNFCDYLGTFEIKTDKTEIKLCFKPIWDDDHPNNVID